MHWRKLAKNPNAATVRRHLQQVLLERRRGRIADTRAFLIDFVRDAVVLDVGVVQHDTSQIDLPHWKHRIIRDVARRVVGIDLVEDGVQELVRRGFDVRCVDATSECDLGERFDRIVMGDVIEHVDSPVALLRFAARHLAPQGRLLVTTPNPFFVTFLLSSLRQGVFIANADHVCWVGPTMALELGHRAGLNLVEYWHVQGPGRTWRRNLAVRFLRLMNLQDAEPFTPAYYFVYCTASES
jgi:SAM-dependent methyltransferase